MNFSQTVPACLVCHGKKAVFNYHCAGIHCRDCRGNEYTPIRTYFFPKPLCGVTAFASNLLYTTSEDYDLDKWELSCHRRCGELGQCPIEAAPRPKASNWSWTPPSTTPTVKWCSYCWLKRAREVLTLEKYEQKPSFTVGEYAVVE